MQTIQYSPQSDCASPNAVGAVPAPSPQPASGLDVPSRNALPVPGPQPSALNPQPPFEPFPGETPRAFGAFMAFFDLGHARSLPGVAVQLGEKPATVKKWSSRYRWRERIQAFNSGLLRQQAEVQSALCARQAADWARRSSEYREQEWAAAQKLLGAVQCFLESFGDRDLEKMTLSQVSRALQVSSHIARQALRGAEGPEGPVLAPIQLELAAALKKAYSQPIPSPAPQPPAGAGCANPLPVSAAN